MIESIDITILDLKLYYREIIKKRKKERKRKPNIKIHIDQSILDKGDQNINWRKDSLFYNWCWENWKSVCRKMKYPAIQHKQMKLLFFQSKIEKKKEEHKFVSKIYKENTKETLYNIALGNGPLVMTLKGQGREP